MTFDSNENLKEIAQALTEKNNVLLFEASLSRVWSHIKDANTKGFAIISANRISNSSKENKNAQESLKSDIRSLGLGFFPVRGHWKECQDTNVSWEDCPEDQLINAVELSFFVTGISLKQANELGNRYEQDAVIYAGPETDGNASFVQKNGKTFQLGKFSPGSISQAYSELKNKQTFMFEGFSWIPSSQTESMLLEFYRDS